MTTAEFDRLPEYSGSLPTGTTIGKRWKRNTNYYRESWAAPKWFIGEYTELIPETAQVLITWYRVELTDAPKPASSKLAVHLL
jgi:hypothetical protein